MRGRTETLVRRARDILSELQDRDALSVIVERDLDDHIVIFERTEGYDPERLDLIIAVEPPPAPTRDDRLTALRDAQEAVRQKMKAIPSAEFDEYKRLGDLISAELANKP